jgi:Lon protease-like protein
MREGLLPLFPLEVVLLPGAALPLHIFEERYKEMIGLCLAESRPFGVVLAHGNGIFKMGCTAAIRKVLERYEDGRIDILASGVERFEIISINTDRSYFRAEVSYFDDDDDRPARPSTVKEAALRREEYARLTGAEIDVVDLEEPQASFLLAGVSTDLKFRQTLLQCRSEADRMELVAAHLKELIERHKARAAISKVSRSNGHGRPLAGGSE